MLDTANASQHELDKFSALAHRWWDPQSEFRPLHEINPLRLGWIADKVQMAGMPILDVGCGGGILSESMASAGANVKGIDLSEKALSVARLHALETGTRVGYELISAEALAEREDGSFDVITCMEMLEHVPDPASTIAACARLAKPGAHLFFSTINRNPQAYLFAILGAEYLLRLLPRGTHDYAKFIKPAELASLCRRAGLEVRDITGMSYNPVTRQYALTGSTSVNYLVHAVRNGQ